MIKPLIYYPNDVLTTKCTVIPNSNELWALKQDFWDTLRYHKGLGLSAPQIGLNYRIFMIDGLLYINPRILSFSSSTTIEEEGCLSLPKRKFLVERSSYIKIEYLSFTMEKINKNLSGLQARIAQHELDHLNGILILDKGKEINE